MKKDILNEQKYAYPESKVDEIQDSIVRDAVDSGCIDNIGKITSTSISHPIRKINVIQVQTDDTTNVNGVEKPLWAFVTSVPSSTSGYYKVDYFYYNKDTGKYVYVNSKDWTCSKLGLKKKITDQLKSVLKFKSEGEQTTDGNYDLVDVKIDASKPENIQLYQKIDSWSTYLNLLKNYKTSLMMFKPVAAKADVMDIEEKKKQILGSFAKNEYYKCSILKSEEGEYATINLHTLYPSVFEKDYTICKSWTQISDSKPDCIAAIDGYYNRIQTYRNAPQKKPNVQELKVERNKVINCVAKWSGKMPFRQKKINFFKELKPSHPFSLRESIDGVTNIIRESLEKLKNKINR